LITVKSAFSDRRDTGIAPEVWADAFETPGGCTRSLDRAAHRKAHIGTV
jgi:hypothetical protein